MRKFLVSVSVAASFALAACDRGPAQAGDQAADAVNPDNVAPEQLRAAVSDPRVKAFYEACDWAAVWTEDEARALTEALRDAPRHGLEALQFLRASDAADNPAQREARLTLAAISYADALANGRVDPKKVQEIYSVPAPRVNVVGGLGQAIGDGKVGDWLAGLAPQDAEYRALSEAFLRYSQASGTNNPQIPAGKAIKPGQSDPRLPAIAAVLRARGYLEAQPAETEAARYSPEMVAAVRRLQKDFGMDVDGVIGNATIEALSKGSADRARTLAINLERRRWLARTPPETRIDVNTAAAMLAYWRDGRVVDARRVVVGQPGWETPPLGSPIFRLVANPPWNVPVSIEEDELAAKGAAYLAANRFTRVNGRLVQASGPDSALGEVKFDMENEHAIYLHDTPAKALFATDDRHSSHGCVRVHNAIQFAQLLAEHDGQRAAFDKALATGEENAVNLKRKIPVRLLYHTAFVENGRVLFRDDAYGWDEDLAERLGMEKRTRRAAPETHISVSGP